ncbi:uncharacterized protein LOC142550884 [Primulina tabacum]|uniref:uncharacterized protein LOC142550884 n=1 Tax=Primulina tabacum TaxID=48773 RepID=UPI003F5AB0B6
MRETQFQTPQKDQITANRRSKITPDLSKKHRKSLNPAFAAISEEKVSDFATEFGSHISDVPVVTPVSELSENSVVNPVDSSVTSTSETIVRSDQAPASSPKSIITSDEHAASVASVPKCENPELDSIKDILPIEAEIVIKHLTTARIQVMKSEVEYESRKLLEVLLETIIKEFHGGLYKERGLVYQLLTSRANLVFLSFMLGALAVFVFSFLRIGESGHSTRSTPT